MKDLEHNTSPVLAHPSVSDADLCDLQCINKSSLLKVLRLRFLDALSVYSRIGDNVLVALNPYMSLPRYISRYKKIVIVTLIVWSVVFLFHHFLCCSVFCELRFYIGVHSDTTRGDFLLPFV